MSAHIAARKYVPLIEAASHFGLSVKTLRRRIADGTLVGYRVGPREIRVNLAEVETALLRPIPTAGRNAS